MLDKFRNPFYFIRLQFFERLSFPDLFQYNINLNMQLTISTVASLLLIGGAIALPEPRSRYARAKEPEVAVNNLGPTDRPGAEDIYNCYILGTNRYPYVSNLKVFLFLRDIVL